MLDPGSGGAFILFTFCLSNFCPSYFLHHVLKPVCSNSMEILGNFVSVISSMFDSLWHIRISIPPASLSTARTTPFLSIPRDLYPLCPPLLPLTVVYFLVDVKNRNADGGGIGSPQKSIQKQNYKNGFVQLS